MKLRALSALAMLVLGLVGCRPEGEPLAMATNDADAKAAIQAAFDAWKEGASPAELAARSPSIQLADDGFRKGAKLVDYSIVGEPTVVGTGITFKLNLKFQDGTAAPRNRTISYRVVTQPNIVISKEDFLP